MRETTKSKIKWTITIISFVLSIFLFGAFVINLTNRAPETTDELGRLDYALGTIDEEGKILESKKSMYSKELQLIKGLKIELSENSTITYKIVFYDEDKAYISTTESLDVAYSSDLEVEGAKYFRVIITPFQVDGEDVILTAFNMGKYIDQLEVIFNK